MFVLVWSVIKKSDWAGVNLISKCEISKICIYTKYDFEIALQNFVFIKYENMGRAERKRGFAESLCANLFSH